MNPYGTYLINLLLPHLMKELVVLMRELKFVLLIPILLSFLSLSIAAGDDQNKKQDASKEYVFISDTQELLNVEYLWNKTNNNVAMTQLIFDDIIELEPGAVFHMGDLVAQGYVNSSWNAVDDFIDGLDDEDIPFYPDRKSVV